MACSDITMESSVMSEFDDPVLIMFTIAREILHGTITMSEIYP